MKTFKQGRYSGFIKPISLFADLIIIIGFGLFYNIASLNQFTFYVYIALSWGTISFFNKFYEVRRNTRIIQVLTLLFKQIILFTVSIYAYLGFFDESDISRLNLRNYLVSISFSILFYKFLVYFLLNKYRSALDGNIRLVVVIGKNDKTRQLIKIFKKKLELGYRFKKQFIVKDDNFSLNECFNYVIDNDIDEIYFSVSELSNKQINHLIDFADNNLRELKFIPDNKEIFSKKLKYEYYDYIPILSLRNIPLKESINKLIKRLFDILFSLFIIIFVLSWLTLVIAILIKLESKGPVFFKQSRNGFNYQEFDCYKFRSMTPNKDAHLHQATKGDTRVTKVGAFIRKTSIDELPQFFNVLFGDMSVVGPRPHMVSHTNMYARKVDKFMVRHFVKPGITGLAQVSGFRGEIETDKDIINRVKYDIFYVENWSLLLDIKIVVQTFINAVRGEKKAY